MNFPKQIQQHKNESYSFAIILYKLRELGIFRNVTSQDYGIDFEIELVEDGRVCGHCVKVQVKSSENLHIGTDGKPTISGIKQTTLRYWAELSYSIPVIALCVDLRSETIYMTEPLFWKAICALDATDSTKTIRFRNNLANDGIVSCIKNIAKNYSLRKELYAHKWLLRNLPSIFEMYNDSWWLDKCCQNIEVHFFQLFLENARVFMNPLRVKNKKDKDDLLFSYDYYYKKSDYDEPYNYVIYEGINTFLPDLLRLFDAYRERVLESGYFWVYNDDEYLKLVAGTEIPTFKDEKELKDFKFDEFFNKQKKSGWFADCLSGIEKNSKCKDGELMCYLISKYGHFEF